MNNAFNKWALGFSGCDGGNIGSTTSPSIWFCGIEWGGGFKDHDISELDKVFAEDYSVPPSGYDNWSENLEYRFNWQAMKLLAVIKGHEIANYKDFAKRECPFVINHTGYFKMNLYPIAFKNTSHELWNANYAKTTGFQTKQEYINWIRENRFPVIKEWTSLYSPKLIICCGISYIEDFKKSFLTACNIITEENIDGKKIYWAKNKCSLVVVIPFMVSPNGLNKNSTIEKFGVRISELLAETAH